MCLLQTYSVSLWFVFSFSWQYISQRSKFLIFNKVKLINFFLHGLCLIIISKKLLTNPKSSIFPLLLSFTSFIMLHFTFSSLILFWVKFCKGVESPLNCKEIQPVHRKGDQSWVFIGRTDVEAETPILWPPDVKSWLIGKDPDAGKDWGQDEKGMTEDEMVGWHHRLDGHGFGWTPGVGDGQGGLACCGSWGHKQSDTIKWLNWLNWTDWCTPLPLHTSTHLLWHKIHTLGRFTPVYYWPLLMEPECHSA